MVKFFVIAALLQGLSFTAAFPATSRLLRRRPVLASEPISGAGIELPRNVLGGDLDCCCADVGGSGIGTGFYRDGFCSTGNQDAGRHTVCIEATAEFLEFSAAVGNELRVAIPEYVPAFVSLPRCLYLCLSV